MRILLSRLDRCIYIIVHTRHGHKIVDDNLRVPYYIHTYGTIMRENSASIFTFFFVLSLQIETTSIAQWLLARNEKKKEKKRKEKSRTEVAKFCYVSSKFFSLFLYFLLFSFFSFFFYITRNSRGFRSRIVKFLHGILFFFPFFPFFQWYRN